MRFLAPFALLAACALAPEARGSQLDRFVGDFHPIPTSESGGD